MSNLAPIVAQKSQTYITGSPIAIFLKLCSIIGHTISTAKSLKRFLEKITKLQRPKANCPKLHRLNHRICLKDFFPKFSCMVGHNKYIKVTEVKFLKKSSFGSSGNFVHMM